MKDNSDEDDFNLTDKRGEEGLVVGKVRLSKDDVRALENGDRLSSIHVAAATTHLQSQFPKHAGFQSTLYLSNGKEKPGSDGAINIHFEVEREHWVTSICGSTQVRYFDSLYYGDIPDSIVEQIKAVYASRKTVQVIRVQQQQGTRDCGLIAIAYAVHLANNKDPSKVKFTQAKMREHYLSCLRNKKLELFPVDKLISRVARPDIIYLV